MAIGVIDITAIITIKTTTTIDADDLKRVAGSSWRSCRVFSNEIRNATLSWRDGNLCQIVPNDARSGGDNDGRQSERPTGWRGSRHS